MREYSIAAIPADGIGPEVIAAGITVLESLQRRTGDVKFNIESFDWGSDYYKRHGIMMPADGLAQLKRFDAIFFGAVGAPDVPDHITLWGLRLPICQGFDQYANVRPTKILPGIQSPLHGVGPGDLDWVIVRENSEGEYSGHGGRAHRGFPEEVGTEVAIFTRVGVTRIMRYAFKLAQARPRKLLTVVTKSNAQRHGMVMWDEIAAEVATEFPDVTWDKMLVDAMTVRMTLKPKSLDTIVATNLHAAHRQHRSRAPLPLDVRADPRFGLRHHGQRNCEPGRHLLDGVADARSSWRGRCLRAAHARGGESDRGGHHDARRRRHGNDQGRHERRGRRHPQLERLTSRNMRPSYATTSTTPIRDWRINCSCEI
jgi:tartrate dehydrogenase